MNNLGRKLEIFVIVTVIAFIGIIYAFKQQPVLAPTTNNPNVALTNQDLNIPSTGQASVNPAAGGQTQQQVQVPSSVVEYQGQDGKNALELLEADHKVDAKHYSFGDLVTGIDGITPDAQHFWAMYVNGSFSQLGASAYITKSTDNIKWEIDAVVDTTK
ncbi:MAG: DUF4430 domain-containing protein [Candidatus Doudnabacteria bacterium]